MTQYRFIGSHPDELEGGRPIEPGEFTGEIDPDAPQNARLIEDGLLIEGKDNTPGAEPEPEPDKTKAKNKSGGSS